MNALTLPPEGLPTNPGGAEVMVLFADERGLLGEFTRFIHSDITHLRGRVLLQLVKAAYPSRTILWAQWADSPRDFGLWNHVLLVKIPGERGYAQPGDDMVGRHQKALAKQKARKQADQRRERRAAGTLFEVSAADVADRFDHEVPSLHEWRSDPGLKGLAKREQFKTVGDAPVETGTEVVAKCCGIHHTAGSYRALELLGATDRTESFTAIHTERRSCSCCKAVLVVETKRLLGGK
jgi:hypothetical protein